MNKEIIDYFNGDELAASTFINKYALIINDRNETPDEMHIRLAKKFARIELNYANKGLVDLKNLDKLSAMGDYVENELSLITSNMVNPIETITNNIYKLFKNFKCIIPGGSVMSGLGNDESIGSLSNCFVLGQPEDSYSGIMKLREEQTHLMKRRKIPMRHYVEIH